MKLKTTSLICSLIFGIHLSFGQKLDKNQLDALSAEQFPIALQELREFLSIPNDAHYPDHVDKNVEFCDELFKKRGFKNVILTTGGPPLMLASRNVKNAKRTVLFYIQVDGQPVDTSKWEQESPYTPVVKMSDSQGKWKTLDWEKVKEGTEDDWRIFARSASDAKGPINMFLAAIDIIDSKHWKPNYDIKVIMDFEEELGSPHLPGAVKKYKDELKADMFVILDGPRHISNQPTLTFGARGISTITLKTFGPRVPQHSGHYGNYVPNPALTMSKLLASMKDDHGRVIIPGYYDGIEIDDKTKEILRNVPDDENAIRKKIGIAAIDKVSDNYQESIQYPSLNIRGLSSAWVGKKVRTIIPDEAIAEIDVRTVPESDPEKLIQSIKKHIETQGFHFVDEKPTEEERAKYTKLISFDYKTSYRAFRTDFNTEIGQWLYKAMKRAFDQEPVRIRIAGGSIPISPFVTTLGIPAVSVPTVNSDNNQHSPNENLRLGNFKDGIKTCLAILTERF
ncbi:M20/M25/M40 family metallo-hydrolase [Fulvivirgaceae bacterium BMA10]|uniref:M20/M25/M40 family metallo-hydrolase n=1 Tax=Splendidivirga corallicola TaxID=3051826 RepID=A0ABT8KQ78_9BACT|nr:M20/M25/M40 family metallo-hydrolase [Fulvivirgaceae bacterium BMA10]